MSEQSPESFACQAGYEDGLHGHSMNSRGFGVQFGHYEDGFRRGRNELWAAIRLIAGTDAGQAALKTYVKEKAS